MKKTFFISPIQRWMGFFFLIFSINLVSAKTCSLSNLGDCLAGIVSSSVGSAVGSAISEIPEMLFEFLLGILNSPIKMLLSIIQSLLTEPVSISLFAEPWAIIIYMLSFFYGLLILFTGFNLILSGESPEKRENAKSSLRNIIIMILLVQLSYYLYELIIDTFSAMTKVVFNMIDQNFFLITTDSITNVGLQFVLLIPYLSVLILFIILLSLRYILVASGVLFFAIGIFMYFIGPLREYGEFIINLLIVAIALPFFYSIVFLCSSKVINVGIFNSFKVLVSLGAFSLVVSLTLLLALLVIIKSALKIVKPVMEVTGMIKALV